MRVFVYWLFSLYSILPFLCFSQNVDSSFIGIVCFPSHLSDTVSQEHTSVKPFYDEALKNYKIGNRIDLSGAINGELGYEKETSKVIKGGTIGEQMWGIINNKISFAYTLLLGNSAFSGYIDSAIQKTDVVPGMGSAYQSKIGYSYLHHFGYLAYSPNKIFNFQAGKDKHFWGDGYRSLFLSDVSNSYPFLKITTSIWKIKYVNLFAAFKDVSAPSHLKKDFLSKYGTFHYLSWNVSKRINLSLFESIIWQGNDENRSRGFDVNYLNPIIFFRPVEYSLGSSDNAFLGMGFKIKTGRKYRQHFYGQIILDEFLLSEIKAMNGWWGNKQGAQLGLRVFDLFSVKDLSFRTEINMVRPYTYSHGSSQQNYAHYNQPLAHPLGANFTESVSFLNYRYKKWFAEAEFLSAIYGKDKNGKNYGGNIFEPYSTRPSDYGNKIGQGIKTNLFFANLRLSYSLVPRSNLYAETGMIYRKETNTVENNSTTYFYLGLRTNIMNNYRDF